jgi:hypothetical protein
MKMRRNPPATELSYPPVDTAFENWRPGPLAVTTAHNLLTESWTADVEVLQTAVERFNADRSLTNECRVVFFEIVRDRHLHVNVTHRYATKGISGWAGPATVADGFVHNRTFYGSQPKQIIRHIRDVIFAERT